MSVSSEFEINSAVQKSVVPPTWPEGECKHVCQPNLPFFASHRVSSMAPIAGRRGQARTRLAPATRCCMALTSALKAPGLQRFLGSTSALAVTLRNIFKLIVASVHLAVGRAV